MNPKHPRASTGKRLGPSHEVATTAGISALARCLERDRQLGLAPFILLRLSEKGRHNALHGPNHPGNLVKTGGDGHLELARVLSSQPPNGEEKVKFKSEGRRGAFPHLPLHTANSPRASHSSLTLNPSRFPLPLLLNSHRPWPLATTLSPDHILELTQSGR